MRFNMFLIAMSALALVVFFALYRIDAGYGKFYDRKWGPSVGNRAIRSAAFENMAYGNSPSQDLCYYHLAVARGGVRKTSPGSGTKPKKQR